MGTAPRIPHCLGVRGEVLDCGSSGLLTGDAPEVFADQTLRLRGVRCGRLAEHRVGSHLGVSQGRSTEAHVPNVKARAHT
jgi:hypothetical protein